MVLTDVVQIYPHHSSTARTAVAIKKRMSKERLSSDQPSASSALRNVVEAFDCSEGGAQETFERRCRELAEICLNHANRFHQQFLNSANCCAEGALEDWQLPTPHRPSHNDRRHRTMITATVRLTRHMLPVLLETTAALRRSALTGLVPG